MTNALHTYSKNLYNYAGANNEYQYILHQDNLSNASIILGVVKNWEETKSFSNIEM